MVHSSMCSFFGLRNIQVLSTLIYQIWFMFIYATTMEVPTKDRSYIVSYQYIWPIDCITNYPT